MNRSTQILVIGGGPAGSIVATLLVREGFEVTLVERDIFPRYHIGESLLPSCLEILEMVGAREKIEAHGFLRKEGGYRITSRIMLPIGNIIREVMRSWEASFSNNPMLCFGGGRQSPAAVHQP